VATEIVMNVFNRWAGTFTAALLASGTALSAVSDPGSIATEQALVALPQENPQARNELDQLFALLSGVDAAYAAANLAQTQAKLEEARSIWNKVSPTLWTRQAQAIQVSFDSLDSELKRGAPAEEVNSSIYEILEELDEIPGVLR
jgi:hypothetical protein